MTAPKRDLAQEITARIIAQLEHGVRPWRKPWNAAHCDGRIVLPLRANGVAYRGINVLLLWMTSVANGYGSPFWLTFRQAREHGAHVRKGERGTTVVYYGQQTRTSVGDEGAEEQESFRFLKGYTVFSADQIEGLDDAWHPRPTPPAPVERLDRCETFFAALPADVRHGGGQAYYAIGSDHIQLPPIEAFESVETYYSTRAHETCHWTRHPSRLDRDFGRKRWGDEGYAVEEIVAEIGASYLGAHLDVPDSHIEDHASYIASWLRVLNNDRKAIFAAAARAQEAVDLLHRLAGTTAEPGVEPGVEGDTEPLAA